MVGEAADGLTAVLAARETRPDVILMDVRMPNVDGLEATPAARGKTEGPRILIRRRSTSTSTSTRRFARARGFLLKDTPPEQLVEAIKIVAAGEALLSPVVTRRDRGVRAQAARYGNACRARALGADGGGAGGAEAPRARDVERRDRRRGRDERDGGEHVDAVLEKLSLRDRVQAVVFAYEHGVVQAGDPADRTPSRRPRTLTLAL